MFEQTFALEAIMDNYEDNDARRTGLHDETRDSPFGTGRFYGPGSGVAFLIGAILVVFAIVAYGMWSGDKGPGGPTTTTIEQPAKPTTQPPATNPPPSPG
jgi:hypothetical protein